MKRILAALLALILGVSLLPTGNVSAASDRVTEIMNSMTVEEKITQTLMMDFGTWGKNAVTTLTPELTAALSEYKFGAVILLAENIDTPEQTLSLTKAMQQATIDGGGVPLIIATDQEGGSITRLSYGTSMPGNMALAATGDTENAVKAGEIIAGELTAVGINTDLAPVLDVNSNPNNPIIGLRSFSDDPQTAAAFGAAYASGIRAGGAAACGKHFPGHGDTDTDSHYGLPVVNKSLEELEENELVPFKAAVEAGIDMIMTAHILYPQIDSSTLYSEKTGAYEQRPATMSQTLISGILKGELGFEGVVCTDGMNMKGITETYGEVQAVVEALAAGADLICMPAADIESTNEFARVDAIIDGVKAALDSGYISEERLDDAVRRILTLKENRGILDYTGDIAEGEIAIRTEEDLQTEREIAAAAVTVVKNENDLLPLSIEDSSVILAVSPSADCSAQIVMGWNRARSAGIVPDGAELQVYTVSAYDCRVSGYLKTCADRADVVICFSDVADSDAMRRGAWESDSVRNMTEYCAENGKPSVVVSINKPYDVQLYDSASAVAAVYGYTGSSVDVIDAFEDDIEYSSDACGPNISAAMEVLLGVYGAQGTLPVTVYRFDTVSGIFTDETVYPRGYGMTLNKYGK